MGGLRVLPLVIGLSLMTCLCLCAAEAGDAGREDVPSLQRRVQELERLGKFKDAAVAAEKLVHLLETIDGGVHSELATALQTLGSLRHKLSQFAIAEEDLKRSLEIREKVFGSDSAEASLSLHALAKLYDDSGQYNKAEAAFDRTVSIRQKIYGPEHPETAHVYVFLGYHCYFTGDYARSEAVLTRARDILKAAGEPELQHLASAYDFLAYLYIALVKYPEAVTAARNAVAVKQKLFAPTHPYVGGSMHVLAYGLFCLNRLDEAEHFYRRGLESREAAFGPDNLSVTDSLAGLASVLLDQRKWSEAESLLRRAVKIQDSNNRGSHPLTAVALASLGRVLHRTERFDEAETCFVRAAEIYEKAFGLNHPRSSVMLFSLISLRLDQGRRAEALELARRHEAAFEALFKNVLSFCSERERLAYKYKIDRFSFLATLDDAEGLANALLRTKGIVLDSIFEDQRFSLDGNPSQKELLTQLRSAQRDLAASVLGSRARASEQQDHARKLTLQIQELERKLGRERSSLPSRQAFEATHTNLQNHLPPAAALVDFVRYHEYQTGRKWISSYGALVICSTGAVKWIKLGPAGPIEEQIKRYRHAVRAATGSRMLADSVEQLYSQVWKPVSAVLPGDLERVYLCPDGELNFISFAGLLHPSGVFLGENLEIAYVGSGRDLFSVAGGPKRLKRLSIWAEPAYDLEAAPAGNLTKLEGTGSEGRALADLATKLGFTEVVLRTGAEATEKSVYGNDTSDVMHLATHGFFLPDQPASNEDPDKVAPQETIRGQSSAIHASPMLRSGLALAGAAATQKAWAGGKVPSLENDGILSAQEIAGLSLGSTWLVVLSACDTALGEARITEGVFGFRRAFRHAGAQNVLMALWPIDDAQTVRFMREFYQEVTSLRSASGALTKTQGKWLKKLREEKGVVEACKIAAPFIMCVSGRNP